MQNLIKRRKNVLLYLLECCGYEGVMEKSIYTDINLCIKEMKKIWKKNKEKWPNNDYYYFDIHKIENNKIIECFNEYVEGSTDSGKQTLVLKPKKRKTNNEKICDW